MTSPDHMSKSCYHPARLKSAVLNLTELQLQHYFQVTKVTRGHSRRFTPTSAITQKKNAIIAHEKGHLSDFWIITDSFGQIRTV